MVSPPATLLPPLLPAAPEAVAAPSTSAQPRSSLPLLLAGLLAPSPLLALGPKGEPGLLQWLALALAAGPSTSEKPAAFGSPSTGSGSNNPAVVSACRRADADAPASSSQLPEVKAGSAGSASSPSPPQLSPPSDPPTASKRSTVTAGRLAGGGGRHSTVTGSLLLRGTPSTASSAAAAAKSCTRSGSSAPSTCCSTCSGCRGGGGGGGGATRVWVCAWPGCPCRCCCCSMCSCCCCCWYLQATKADNPCSQAAEKRWPAAGPTFHSPLSLSLSKATA